MKLKDTLLGRIAMTDLGSALKHIDIILPTKVCMVKAMVSPVDTYRCESWTIKSEPFQTVVLEKTLESPLETGRKSNYSVLKNLINHEYSLEGLLLNLQFQYFGHRMQRAWSLERALTLGKTEGKRRKGWQKMKWLASTTRAMDLNLSKLQKIVEDREAWCASFYGVEKSWTQLSDWTTI